MHAEVYEIVALCTHCEPIHKVPKQLIRVQPFATLERRRNLGEIACGIDTGGIIAFRL